MPLGRSDQGKLAFHVLAEASRQFFEPPPMGTVLVKVEDNLRHAVTEDEDNAELIPP